MIFLAPIQWLIDFFNGISVITMANSMPYVSVVFDILNVVCYLIPVYALVPLIKLSLAIVSFKIVISIIRLIIDLVPLW